jgi:hypothetical protein
MEIKLIMPSDSFLDKLQVSDKNAVKIYLAALQLGIPEALVKIGAQDKRKLYSNKVVEVEFDEFDNNVKINLDAEGSLNLVINSIEAQVEDFYDEYRKLFKNKKPGAMGSEATVKVNLAKFLEKYKQYSKEDILEAAKLYVDSFITDATYMRQADYFIFKQIYPGGPVKSTLLEVLENKEQYIKNTTSWNKML